MSLLTDAHRMYVMSVMNFAAAMSEATAGGESKDDDEILSEGPAVVLDSFQDTDYIDELYNESKVFNETRRRSSNPDDVIVLQVP